VNRLPARVCDGATKLGGRAPERQQVLVTGRRSGQDRGLADVLQREWPPLSARVGDTCRIRLPLRPAGRNCDVKRAGNLYFRAVLKRVQGQSAAHVHP